MLIGWSFCWSNWEHVDEKNHIVSTKPMYSKQFMNVESDEKLLYSRTDYAECNTVTPMGSFLTSPSLPPSLSGLWSDHNGAIKVMKSGENVTIVIKVRYVHGYLCSSSRFTVLRPTVEQHLHEPSHAAQSPPMGPPCHQIRPKFLKSAKITKRRVSSKVCRENLKRWKCIRSQR